MATTQWEYCELTAWTITHYKLSGREEVKFSNEQIESGEYGKRIAKLGLEGWELASAATGYNSLITMYFKRPIAE